MAHTDGFTIGELGIDAVPEALPLAVEVGWNQTAEDWAYSIAHGTVYGARDSSRRLVATAAVLPYAGISPDQPGFAWVSLVIVTAVHRGRGLGAQLLHQCIATLGSRSLTGLLDATPAGEKIYTPLGFKPLLGLRRWQGEGGGAFGLRERVQPLTVTRMDGIAALDTRASGAQRRTLLMNLCARPETRGFELVDGSGYALVRAGRVASYVGPVVAASAADAIAVIDAAVTSTPGLIFIDVPDLQAQTAAWLGAHGFTVQRPLLRMALGPDLPRGDPARVFAIAGPEYG